MKKVLFALFVISASTFTIQESKATEPVEEKWVCCQETTNETCTDILGNGHFGTVKKPKC